MSRATLLFVDECGVSQKPTVAKTWARRGKTPKLIHNFNWKKDSVISGITPTGKLYFQLFRDSVKKEQVISFLDELRHNIKRPIFIVWDGARSHTSKMVKDYVEKHKNRFAIFRFPPYCPELNPDEKVWSQLKYREIANCNPESLWELEILVETALERIAEKPALIRSFVYNTFI